jgi:uncharacterized membrane protein (UPF0127 family)
MSAQRASSGIAFLLALAACGGTDTEPAQDAALPPAASVQPTSVTFDTATATFIVAGREIPIRVEIAERPDQRAFGLMDRDSLGADAGMIFLYQEIQDASSSFWMYRTRIPLDIAFFDGAGRIVAIRQMLPCASPDAARCPSYPAGAPFYGAVEANRGHFARSGIGTGDRIVLPGRIGG